MITCFFLYKLTDRSKRTKVRIREFLAITRGSSPSKASRPMVV